jgi:hypothetical protein
MEDERFGRPAASLAFSVKSSWYPDCSTCACQCLTEVIVRRIALPVIACLGLAAAVLLWPADVSAQGRAVPRVRHAPRRVVVVRAHRFRPFYRPFYSSFYGGLFWQRYPYPYPYPYPYYGYRYDDRAEVRIQGEQKDAEVYVDGYFAGTVDDFDGFAQRLRLEPGDHEITLYHPSYRTWREQVRVRPRQSLTIPSVLEPLAAGDQPDTRPEPPASAPRYERGRPGERAPGPPDRPAERGAVGTLSMRVQPVDADVWIDGEAWDWPEGEARLVVDLPEGSHRVEVRREGHRPYSTTVDVRRGETTTLNVSLLKGEG